jgi:hypothetical protein
MFMYVCLRAIGLPVNANSSLVFASEPEIKHNSHCEFWGLLSGLAEGPSLL